jgi:hypothetical protein
MDGSSRLSGPSEEQYRRDFGLREYIFNNQSKKSSILQENHSWRFEILDN